MEIKVTGCHDCPFAKPDYNKVNWCINPTNKDGAFDVEHNRFWETIHPSCPLKQQSITVKLEEDGK